MGKTIRDVADAAGVSTATVSRVMSPGKPAPVAETTRLRVIAAVEKLGYRANHAARSLKRQSTMTVAVVFPELANDFYMDVAGGIERELNAHGYTMLMASSLNSVEEEKKRISMLADRMVDGMLVIPAGSQGGHLQALADQGMPIVLVDRLVEGAALDAVASDNEEGTFLLTRALLSDGFKRIAFVGGEITLSAARERLSGFARALAEAGIQPEPSWICLGGMEVEDGYQWMGNLLNGRNPPDAMVAVNLLVHLGMERRLLDMRGFAPGGAAPGNAAPGNAASGNAAPGNAASGNAAPKVVIAGFDEARYTPFLPACRYTASQDAAGIGRRAGQRIIEKIQEKKAGDFAGDFSGKRIKAARQIIRLPVTISRSQSGGLSEYGVVNRAAS